MASSRHIDQEWRISLVDPPLHDILYLLNESGQTAALPVDAVAPVYEAITEHKHCADAVDAFSLSPEEPSDDKKLGLSVENCHELHLQHGGKAVFELLELTAHLFVELVYHAEGEQRH